MFDQFLTRLRAMIENRGLLTLEELGPVRNGLDRLLVREKDGWTVFVAGSPKEASIEAKQFPGLATGPAFVRSELLLI